MRKSNESREGKGFPILGRIVKQNRRPPVTSGEEAPFPVIESKESTLSQEAVRRICLQAMGGKCIWSP